jgi:DHA1 family bicyclomycin/chloramphenicol resistance-like MFS transporter
MTTASLAAPSDPVRGPARPPVILLVAISAIGPLALNIFVPSIPGLASAFQASHGTVQLTLTLYLVGVAVGQLLYGPLSDRFGRRPLLLGGLALFLVASLLCAFATSIGWLILGRVFQAVGGCSGLVLGRAIVRDVYGRDRAASVLAYVTMGMAVAPMVAPAIGGQLDVWMGWRASFLLLLVLGAATLAWSALSLGETHHDRRPLPGAAGMALGFARLLGRRAFLGYALNTAFTSAVFFGFLAGAPRLMTDVLHEPPSTYGALFILVSAGYIVGNFVAGRLSVAVGTERMVLAGSLVSAAGAALMIAWLLGPGLGPLALFVPMTLVGIGNGIGMPNAIAAAVSVDPQAAGTASGLLGFLQMGVGALATVLVGAIGGDGALPMALVLAAFALLTLSAWWVGSRAARAPQD